MALDGSEDVGPPEPAKKKIKERHVKNLLSPQNCYLRLLFFFFFRKTRVCIRLAAAKNTIGGAAAEAQKSGKFKSAVEA